MSARRFARDVPRSVQHAVLAALDLVDDSGEVRGGMPALQAALNHDDASATRRVVAEAERWKLLKRKGAVGHGARRVVVVGHAKQWAVEARAVLHESAGARMSSDTLTM